MRGLPVRKSVFEVADPEVAHRIVDEAVRRKLPAEIRDPTAARPLVVVTHREYERDAAEMLVMSLDPSASRHVEAT